MPVCYKTGCKRLLTRVRLQWSPPIWFPYCRSTLRPPTWGRVSTLGSWWPGWGLHLSGLIGSLEKCCGTSLVLQPQTVRVSFPLSVCLVLFFFFFWVAGCISPWPWSESWKGLCSFLRYPSLLPCLGSGPRAPVLRMFPPLLLSEQGLPGQGDSRILG